jgi:hypothetical protein
LLACSWPHSVGQNHFFVMMLFNRDSAIQSASRRFCTVSKSENSVPSQSSRQHDIPSGCPTVQSIIQPDDENFSFGPSSVLRSFELLQLASVRTFQQHFRPLFTLVLLKSLGGVIFVWFLLLLCFTICPFVTKRGSNFLFGPGLYF